jgi:aerobic carbon-monoxide dehydrogenase large subunit
MHRKEDARFLRGRATTSTTSAARHAARRDPAQPDRARPDRVGIDTSAAEAHPKVKAVITGETLEGSASPGCPRCRRTPSRCSCTDKVRFQGQEVAFVIAEDRYSARDALQLIDVDYEPLEAVVDAKKALDPTPRSSATTSRAGPTTTSTTGRPATPPRCDEVFAQRRGGRHPGDALPAGAPGTDGDLRVGRHMDPISGKLTIWTTTQAPHAHRTVYALVAGLPEHKIQVISPDIGGGFGNKVGIYPGYVCSIVGSIVTGKPVKWMEDRSENLMSTSFARDYHMTGSIAATRDGKIQGLKVDVLADHGAFNGVAQPTKFPAGFFHIFTGSYDYDAAHCKVTAVYTNKAPGGVAYACSFRSPRRSTSSSAWSTASPTSSAWIPPSCG